jgi:predicted DNA-binding protein
MNERIRQLLLQVVPMAGEDGEYLPSLHTPEDIERFAELIIRECIDAAIESQADYYIIENIKSRFGVEK